MSLTSPANRLRGGETPSIPEAYRTSSRIAVLLRSSHLGSRLSTFSEDPTQQGVEMKPRYTNFLLVVFCATAAQGVMSTAAAQSRISDAGVWEVPRTSDGHPDLQGNWTNVTLTPFEREVGSGPLFTWEEVEDIERVTEGCPPNPGTVECGREDSQGDESLSNESRLSGAEYNEVYWDRGSTVAIVDGEPRTSLVTRPSDGRRPALTPEGERRIEKYEALRDQFGPYDHPELRPLGERCVVSFGSSAGPPMMPNTAYNNNYTIVQNADHVMILAEMVHDVRIIRLGDSRPMPRDIRPWFGDSWGRWEGNTLVVETTNIHPDQMFRGIPPSEHLKVIERLTRVDEETILYEFTVEDPTTYTEPWGGEIPFKRFEDLLYEYACHEGNYSLYGVLSGARYQETIEAQEPTELR